MKRKVDLQAVPGWRSLRRAADIIRIQRYCDKRTLYCEKPRLWGFWVYPDLFVEVNPRLPSEPTIRVTEMAQRFAARVFRHFSNGK